MKGLFYSYSIHYFFQKDIFFLNIIFLYKIQYFNIQFNVIIIIILKKVIMEF